MNKADNTADIIADITADIIADITADSTAGTPDTLSICGLFEPGHSLAWGYLSSYLWPWEALAGIRAFIMELGAGLSETEYERRGGSVWVHRTAKVAPTAYIGDAVIICADAEIRHCAFIRGSALVGAGAVVGNSTELKNSILFDRVQAPHFNYVGDSILGFRAHMGAGSITSNVKNDRTPVAVSYGGAHIETRLRKFGAILGDNVEVGCNSVLNPGSVVGPGASIYPLSSVRGYVPANSIYKRQGDIVKKNSHSAASG